MRYKMRFTQGLGLLLCSTALVTGCAMPTPSTPAPATPAATVEATTPEIDTITNTTEVTTNATLTSTETVSDTTTTATGEASPLAAETCTTLQSAVAEALGVAIEQDEAAPFTSAFGDLTGQSCRLSATGTGENFTNFVDVAQKLTALLESQGWTQDMNYVADGPTGTVVGLRHTGADNGNQLAILAVNWEPAPDVTCPQDQPISACAEQLEPAQMLYTITLDLVELP